MLKLLALLFGMAKLGKLGGTLITMVISLGAYSLAFGWRYAAGFIGLLFLHEMGHFLAAREKGLAVGAPTFIPFVGAWIELKEEPMDVATEAFVAAAGPFIGTVGATAVYLWGSETHDNLLLAIAYSGFFLNFFNLIPISPLDGGRMTAILSPRIWFLGVPVIVALMIVRPSPLLVLVALLAMPSLVKAWKYDPTTDENRAYYGAPLALKVEYGLFYLGMLAFLAVMTEATHDMVGPARG